MAENRFGVPLVEPPNKDGVGELATGVLVLPKSGPLPSKVGVPTDRVLNSGCGEPLICVPWQPMLRPSAASTMAEAELRASRAKQSI